MMIAASLSNLVLSTSRMQMRGFFSPALISRSISGTMSRRMSSSVGVEILGLGVARRLDPRAIFGAVMAHHDHRRLVEPVDQQARFIPDRDGDRAERFCHALVTKPLFGTGDKRCGSLAVERLEQAPLAQAWLHVNLNQIVDLGADPADDAAVALRQEEGRVTMAEPGVLLRVEQGMHLTLERRHPSGVVLVNFPHEIDERLAVAAAGDGADLEVAHAGEGLTAHYRLVTSGSAAAV